jgi:hypothetical protein
MRMIFFLMLFLFLTTEDYGAGRLRNQNLPVAVHGLAHRNHFVRNEVCQYKDLIQPESGMNIW